MKQNEMQEIGETVVKGKDKGSRSPRPNQQPQTEPGDNTKYVKHSMQIANLKQIDLKDAEQTNARVFEYFSICEKNDMKPSVAGLALALGVDRKTVWVIRTGQANYPDAVRNTVKRAVQIINAMMEDYMQNGKINPVSGIFLMKNNMDYTDKQEVVVTPNNQMGDTTDMRQLEEKYRNSVVIDTDGEEISE